jgi:hypothetical protein
MTSQATRTSGVPSTVLALVGAAVAWGVMLLVLAMVLPVVTRESSVPAPPPGQISTTVSTTTHVTLVADNGYGVLALIALPVLASVLAGVLLRINASTGRGPAGVAAYVVASLVLAAGVVGFLTFLIGGAVVPIGILLLMACFRGAPASRLHPVTQHARQHGEQA